MPRMTTKYAAAWRLLGQPEPRPDAEQLYAHLRAGNRFWNSDTGEWEYHDPAEAKPPMEGVAIRVWAATEHAAKAAQALAHALHLVYGWRLIETSEPYQCRPPQQLESRVYMKFLPRSDE